MSQQSHTLFIVDDEPSARLIIGHHLQQESFRIREFGDAASCLLALDQEPDSPLLDVHMPGMDGIGLCREIRRRSCQAQVLFVSVHDDLETRIQTYEAGGQDFIVKPFAPEELERKVQLAVAAIQTRRELTEQVAFATNTAFTAMSSLGEMKAVIELLRNSFSARTLEQLGRQLLQAVQEYGLSGIVGFYSELDCSCLSLEGPCTPLETSILGNVRLMSRILQFRDRLVVNYERVSLVVGGLPLEDEDRIGRLRDHLALMVESVDARAAALQQERQCQRQEQGIASLIGELGGRLVAIEQQIKTNQDASRECVLAYLTSLEQSFLSLGLAEEQEKRLLAQANRYMDRLSDIHFAERELTEHLQQSIQSLKDLLPNAQT